MTRGELINAINDLYERIDGCAPRMDREAGRCSHWPKVQSETDKRIAADFDELRLHVMLSCLPEYMRYCNDIEGPTLTLAEWWSAQPDEVQP